MPVYPTSLDFVLLNQSTDTGVTLEVLTLIAAALNEQMNCHFTPAYGGTYITRLGSSTQDRHPGEIAINIADSHPSEPDALGWHQVIGGIPDIEISLALCKGITIGQLALSTVISHEVCETAGDPGANGWEQREDGNLEARETCDRVESTNYPASNGVSLSNFLLPNTWIPGSPGPYDFMGVLKNAGDTATQSYDIIAGAPAGEQSVWGDDVASHLRRLANLVEAKEQHVRAHIVGTPHPVSLERKKSPYSRAHRRGIRL